MGRGSVSCEEELATVWERQLDYLWRQGLALGP